MGSLAGAQQGSCGKPLPPRVHFSLRIARLAPSARSHRRQQQQQQKEASNESSAACPLCRMRGAQQQVHRGPLVLRAAGQHATEVTTAAHELEAQLNKRARLESVPSPVQRSTAGNSILISSPAVDEPADLRRTSVVPSMLGLPTSRQLLLQARGATQLQPSPPQQRGTRPSC